MKIGIITNLYPPHARGGAENVIVRTVTQLVSMGHDVFVITGQPKGKPLTLDRAPTERVYRFFPPNIYFTLDDHKHRWFVRLLWHIVDTFSPLPARTVGKILDDEKPDVVFTHNLMGLGFTIPRAVQSRCIPHIHVLHDLQLILPSGLLLAGKEYLLKAYAIPYGVYRAICRMQFGTPDMVISPSQFIVDEYTKHRFFAGIPFLLQPNPTPNFQVVDRHERADGPLKLLFVGQLNSHKGIMFLLDAFAGVVDNVELLIVGEGPLSAEVRARAAKDKRISHLGYMAPDELVKCYSVADALVVPSLCYENSPTVIYEALNAGIPVLASRIGGVGELVREGETGYLFTPGNASHLLHAIALLDAHRADFAARRSQLRASVAPFALDKYAERLLELAREVIAKP